MRRFWRFLASLTLLTVVAACGTPQAGHIENAAEADVSSAMVDAAEEPATAPTAQPNARATKSPTWTPIPPTSVSATAAPVTASVITDANVRDQPTTEGSTVLDVVRAGETVRLEMRNAEGTWLGVVNDRGVRGWVSASLLTADAAIVGGLPEGGSTDAAVAVAEEAALPAVVEEPAAEAAPAEEAPADGALVMPRGLVEARVSRVVDGDTVDVVVGGATERLRLIGIDTPETVDPRKPVQCFGQEASAKAHELLDGQTVWLETDASQDSRDRYGRMLAYVWLQGDKLYNLEMIIHGYAHEYTYETPYKYQALFKQEEQGAAARGWGLWAATSCNGNTELAADPGPAPAAPPPPAQLPVAPPPPAASGNCDPSYPDFCLPVDIADLDCGDMQWSGFRVIGADRHRFDGDNDGVGCE